ncbi:glutamine-hydrolyzing carbamoyl-phosphate synthase small subunit [Fusibacter ferrireducens]|uniref:Carbamoyl phosphate synthase small chain n=1 Tax=Fusibacter ferrireducens TaxID=2785058 RepID=A0ABS0A0B1_9FIRM|nr:glutamine-hydrolyzing carbamoyl-phosphate synthase small subunit [Fusibacter ferrireducens]MBF4695883.1 glutamine-hydrolyzing carbamoyl-phosphate synthase small subunit [Fusibacter ferrireducens]
MKGYLVLEDGFVLEGKLFGSLEKSIGEVVFNTGMTGYEEIITDPSYFGQMVILTYPIIGNYGINLEDIQSGGPQIKGLIVREFVGNYSNWRGKMTLSAYLEAHKIIGIEQLDTRALVKHIRDKGTMIGVIVTEKVFKSVDGDLQKLLTEKDNLVSGEALLEAVSTKESYVMDTVTEANDYKVAVLDFGIKRNILESLAYRTGHVKVFPAFTSYEEIMAYNPDGVFLSNGPGDPEDYKSVVEVVKRLLDSKPVFGICLGHQLIALALGAKTQKLKFGHRGSNHPVKDLMLNKVMITSQNHGYVVVKETLEPLDVTITHLNVNDGSLEGIKHNSKPVFSVQYHPEASPGPGDSAYLFDQFIAMMEETKNAK